MDERGIGAGRGVDQSESYSAQLRDLSSPNSMPSAIAIRGYVASWFSDCAQSGYKLVIRTARICALTYGRSNP
jgi:hypothetical protein